MSIDFHLMRHPAGGWLLYDAEIDGVSIVDNYRAQFAAIIREFSYAGLIAQMKQRTLLMKLFEKDSCL
jgi:phospholipid transport system substrate-binding protein